MSTTLLDDFDGFQKLVEQNFDESGHLVPALLLNKNGEVEVVGIVENSPKFKEIAHQIITKAIQNEGLKEFIFVTEAWMASGNQESVNEAVKHVRKGQSLETFGGRTEIVSVQYASPAKEILYKAEIFRPKDEKPYLGEWDANETDQSALAQCVTMNTRFNFLWHRLATGQN